MVATYPGPSILAFSIISMVGTITNAFSICLIAKKLSIGHNQKTIKTIFLLVLLDAVTSFICCLTCFLLSFVMLDSNNEVACSMLFLGIYFPSVLGPLFTAEVAIIRYIALKLSLRNKQLKERRIRIICLCSALFFLAYVFSSIAVHVYNELPFSLVTEVCMHGGKTPRHLSPATIVSILWPTFLLPVTSLIFDTLIVKVIRRNMLRPERRVFQVPVRATFLSAVALLPYVIIGVLLKVSHVSPTTSATALLIVALTVASFRCPMTTLVTFTHRSSHSLEARRAKVLAFAIRERERRISSSLQPQLSTISAICQEPAIKIQTLQI